METVKIDRSKLLTVTNYAKKTGMSRQAIHYQVKKKYLETIEIDGVLFIKTK